MEHLLWPTRKDLCWDSNLKHVTRAGGVAQAEARLPSKHEALSSNPRPTQKKKKERLKHVTS
jgi:hypothetical protein